MSSDVPRSLTSGRLLAANALWNLVGMGAPAIVGLIAIPLLINGMGTDRFGLLTIIWVGVGYFSLFDLGVGRALTKLVSERLGSDPSDDLHDLIWTGIIALGTAGAVGGIVVALLSRTLVVDVFSVDSALEVEATTAFRLLGAGLPLVILTASLIGILQAHQRFGTIAAIRAPLGVMTFIGPVITVQFSPSISWATAAILMSRSGSLLAYYLVSRRVQNELNHPIGPKRSHLVELLSFGGWVTITNLVGPLLTYLDRFIVASIVSVSTVAFYTTPYEALSRLQMVPQSLMAVTFPAMSTAQARDRDRMVYLYSASSTVTLFSMLPVLSAAFLLAPEALTLWLGDEFSMRSTLVVRWLTIGWMVNTLARPPFTILQSVGRPDLVAKIHLTELPPYVALLFILTPRYGISGAAATWAGRAIVDAMLLNLAAARHIPPIRRETVRSLRIGGLITAGAGLAWYLAPLSARLAVLACVSLLCIVYLRPVFEILMHRNSSPRTA